LPNKIERDENINYSNLSSKDYNKPSFDNTNDHKDITVSNKNGNQDFTELVNRSLDQTKDKINRSIEESRKQIPQYNNIVNSYQEQTLHAVKEISENYIESQKSIINSYQSACGPFSQNLNTTAIILNSPETAANAYSRIVSTVADNAVYALRTTNNYLVSGLPLWKSTLQQARDSSKEYSRLTKKMAETYVSMSPYQVGMPIVEPP